MNTKMNRTINRTKAGKETVNRRFLYVIEHEQGFVERPGTADSPVNRTVFTKDVTRARIYRTVTSAGPAAREVARIMTANGKKTTEEDFRIVPVSLEVHQAI